MRWLFYIVIIVCVLMLQLASDQMSLDAMSIWVVVAVVAFGLFTVARAYGSPVNPFSVYAALILAVLVGGAWVLALSALGPAAVTMLVVALSGITLWLTFAHGDAKRHRREGMGLCGRCGYDLRASPDVCPECGAAVNEDLKRRRRIAAELAAKRAAKRAEHDNPTHVITSTANDISANPRQSV
jgi:hypothetical protein